MKQVECTKRGWIDAHFAGRIGPGEEHELRAHLETCESCRRHYHQHLLLARLDPRAAQAKDRLQGGLGLDRPRPGGWGLRLPLGLGIAATATVLAVVALTTTPPDRVPDFTPRGSIGETPAPRIMIFDLPASGDGNEVGDEIRPDAELAIAYDNPMGARWLMVFATSPSGEVFWYCPAWTDAKQNPSAISIEMGRHEIPRAVVHPLSGNEITVHALFLDAPMSVREVEELLETPTELTGRAVHHFEKTLRIVRSDR